VGWERLSVRNGDEEPDALFEGVPNHLMAPLTQKIRDYFTYTRANHVKINLVSVSNIAVKCRIALSNAGNGPNALNEIINACYGDQIVFLNVLDACLSKCSEGWREEIRSLLEIGGSAWTTSDLNGLERVVDPLARTVAREAMTPNDKASAELREAWSSAYGMSPNPSDVWDHAIKALEEILIPVVTPKQNNATLGHVVSHLASQGDLWRFAIPGADKSYSVDPLVQVLKLVWPNIDRHGGGSGRAADLAEAQAVLHAAIMAIQWIRAGALIRR
jgi:hypothetical protein